jgi:tRNA-dihydrouridine synthase B
MRTGWDPGMRNGVRVARLAAAAGVQALAVHGRTRACRFEGHAEFATVAEIKQAVDIPVIANGDIDSPEKALEVLRATAADAVMIGRAAQGRPWIFREIDARLRGDVTHTEASLAEQRDMMLAHLRDLHAFYGEGPGVRIARKHVGWYCRDRPQALTFRQAVMQAETAEAQLELVVGFFGDDARATAA